MVGITQARTVPALESLEDFEKSFPGLVHFLNKQKNQFK